MHIVVVPRPHDQRILLALLQCRSADRRYGDHAVFVLLVIPARRQLYILILAARQPHQVPVLHRLAHAYARRCAVYKMECALYRRYVTDHRRYRRSPRMRIHTITRYALVPVRVHRCYPDLIFHARDHPVAQIQFRARFCHFQHMVVIEHPVLRRVLQTIPADLDRVLSRHRCQARRRFQAADRHNDIRRAKLRLLCERVLRAHPYVILSRLYLDIRRVARLVIIYYPLERFRTSQRRFQRICQIYLIVRHLVIRLAYADRIPCNLKALIRQCHIRDVRRRRVAYLIRNARGLLALADHVYRRQLILQRLVQYPVRQFR